MIELLLINGVPVNVSSSPYDLRGNRASFTIEVQERVGVEAGVKAGVGASSTGMGKNVWVKIKVTVTSQGQDTSKSQA